MGIDIVGPFSFDLHYLRLAPKAVADGLRLPECRKRKLGHPFHRGHKVGDPRHTLGPQGWHPSYRFHQPTLESLLRAKLASHGNATVRLRHDLFAIEEHADHVGLRIEDGGEQWFEWNEVKSARLVVADPWNRGSKPDSEKRGGSR